MWASIRCAVVSARIFDIHGHKTPPPWGMCPCGEHHSICQIEKSRNSTHHFAACACALQNVYPTCRTRADYIYLLHRNSRRQIDNAHLFFIRLAVCGLGSLHSRVRRLVASFCQRRRMGCHRYVCDGYGNDGTTDWPRSSSGASCCRNETGVY